MIPSVSFLGVSLVNVQAQKSHFLSCLQLIKTTKTEAAVVSSALSEPSNTGFKQKRGRPKGSKNKPYTEPESLSFVTFKSPVDDLLLQLARHCASIILPYIVLEGFYDNQHYLKYAQSKGLKMISKLKCNAHLILPYLSEKTKAEADPKNMIKS